MLVEEDLSSEAPSTEGTLERPDVSLEIKVTHFGSEVDHQVARTSERLPALHKWTQQLELHLPRLVRLQHFHSTHLVLLPLLPMSATHPLTQENTYLDRDDG